MSVLVAGSVGLDTIETPKARREELLGGSAVYFALAAGQYAKVHLVSVVGEDFPPAHRRLLESRGFGLDGFVTAPGRTFRWSGRYHANFNDRDTLKTELNVLGSFAPQVPAVARESDYVFLANGPCAIQMGVLRQLGRRPKFVLADTMDLWIRTTPDEVAQLLRQVDALVLNDSEARLLTGHRELCRAGREILSRGPRSVVIKKGEHGAMLLTDGELFVLPAFPLEEVVDPTGAGDSFAGGFLGYLAATGDTSPENLRRALLHGTVVASFTCQDYSVDGLVRLTRRELDERYAKLREMVRVPA